ncbi:MAG: hypothetical protein OMOMHJEC_03264 [Xanthomonadales bacterium]|nr:hypothetical protein [Xanthomonadales bacterium]
MQAAKPVRLPPPGESDAAGADAATGLSVARPFPAQPPAASSLSDMATVPAKLAEPEATAAFAEATEPVEETASPATAMAPSDQRAEDAPAFRQQAAAPAEPLADPAPRAPALAAPPPTPAAAAAPAPQPAPAADIPQRSDLAGPSPGARKRAAEGLTASEKSRDLERVRAAAGQSPSAAGLDVDAQAQASDAAFAGLLRRLREARARGDEVEALRLLGEVRRLYPQRDLPEDLAAWAESQQ